MSNDLVGYLEEEGWTPAEIDDAISPMDRYEGRSVADDAPPGSDGHEVLRAVLTAARDSRQPPGRQDITPTGTNAPPDGAGLPAKTKAVRVDTEETYRNFRQAQGGGDPLLEDTPEDRLEMELMPGDEDVDLLGYTARQMELLGIKRSRRVVVGIVGPTGDQRCVLCGAPGAGSAICGPCRGKHAKGLNAILGFGERGPASNIYGRGAGGAGPSGLYDALLGHRRGATRVGYTARQWGMDNPTPDADLFGIGTASQLEMLGGDEDVDLLGYTARQMELLGYTARQMELLGYTARQMELIGEVDALESPMPADDTPQEEIPLSFANPLDEEHITSWRQGGHIFASIRVVGWDGQPRVLTGTMPFRKSMGIVVGYVAKAGIAPAHALGLLEPLASRLGASSVIPKLAAGSPELLGLARTKAAPFVAAISPRRR